MLAHTLSEWLTLLEAKHARWIDLSLRRMQQAVQALQLKPFDAPIITVAGTNGKGSTVCALETIYHAAGYRTASYTSPHLFFFNERIKINTQSIDDEQLCNAFAAVYPTAQQYQLTYFEAITLAAFWIFKNTPLDIIILEIGLGGRLDAVNVMDPILSIITSIDLDHTDRLGDTRSAIAKEKAGIFRENTPVICGDPNPPEILEQIANELHAPFYLVANNAITENTLLPENMKIAQAAIIQLQNILPVSEEKIVLGIQQCHLPGRQQVVYRKCKHIFDVAHNPAGLKKLAQRIEKEKSKKVLLVIGMLATKDLFNSFLEIKNNIDVWYVAPIHNENAATLEQLKAPLDALKITNVHYYATLNDAYQNAFDAADTEDLLIIAGSFYTVAEIFLGNFNVKQAPPPAGFVADNVP